MEKKPRFIELNYHQHDELRTPGEVIALHRPSNLFTAFLSDRADITLVKHAAFTGTCHLDQTRYVFFNRRNRFFQVPRATHNFIVSQQPDFLLVQGLIFPVQAIALARRLGNCKIVMQHQGEVPYRRKRFLQRWADRYVHAYIFTSSGNAAEWLDAGVIRDAGKCYEIIPSSTTFTQQDKVASKIKTGMQAPVNFLWVGRLNANKDPLTVLAGFESYFIQNPGHRLYMIYGEDDLLDTIRKWLCDHPAVENCVQLVGKISHDKLEDWYSAADYFVSGSHREGGSYALTEAMACGCIPIVTNIPAAMKVTATASTGYCYHPGDPVGLSHLLTGLDHSAIAERAADTLQHFKKHYAPAAIADQFWQLYEALQRK